MSKARYAPYGIWEGTFLVASYRNAIAPGDNCGDYGGENKGSDLLIQFYAVEGGLRSVQLGDIADIK